MDNRYSNQISARRGYRDEDTLEQDQEQDLDSFLVLPKQQQWKDKHSQRKGYRGEDLNQDQGQDYKVTRKF